MSMPASRRPRLVSFASLASLTILGACKTREFNTKQASTPPGGPSCAAPVAIDAYARPSVSCYAGTRNVENPKFTRKLYPWVPCNAVEFFSHAGKPAAGESVGNGRYDYEAALATIAGRNWFPAGKADEYVSHALSGADDTHPDLTAHPALGSPLHEGMVKVIRSAKKTLFLDIMLFGGAWGTEIVREMMKQQRLNPGLQIVFLRDNENTFVFNPELDPLWNALRARSDADTTGTFVALDADLVTKDVNGLPLGAGRATDGLLDLAAKFKHVDAVLDSVTRKYLSTKLNLAGRSDHSKIIIADGLGEHPVMWVASKNPTDNNLLNYDEGLVVWGPGAAVAQVAYARDLDLAARQLAKRGGKGPGVAGAQALVAAWVKAAADASAPRSSYRASVPPGLPRDVDVRAIENNGDASVRNVEHGLLQLIRGAKSSVRMYNMLAYNPGVAQAVADAVGRLGAANVKILVDQALTFTPNLVFREMVKGEVAKLKANPPSWADAQYAARLDAWEDVFRWRVNLAAKHFAKGEGASAADKARIDIDQQQHTKTVLIDADETKAVPGAIVFVGSANFDLITFGGSFREFSVAARSQAPGGKGAVAAREAAAVFEGIWRNPAEAATTDALFKSRAAKGDALPNDELIRAAKAVMDKEYAGRSGLMPVDIRAPEKCH